MNRINRKIQILLGFAVFASGAMADINLSLGTYIYAGTIKNFRNEALSASMESDAISIQAIGEDGSILAESSIVEPDRASGVNFRLEVPVSSFRTAKSAAIGDAPSCVIVTSSGARGAATERFPEITCASCVTNCTIVWLDTVNYTNGEDVAIVPKAYIDGISYLVRYYGYTEYNPWADWDGDGASNYAEYMAGTNPFNKSDYLRVTGFSAGSDATLLSFEYVGGHLYALKSASSLVSPKWITTGFTTDSGDAIQNTLYAPNGDDDEPGVATLYVTPASDNPQMFFRVEVK